MTIISLVRHGAYALLDQALGGRANHALNDEGRIQAARAGQLLGASSIAAIVSSPVERALETATIIAASLGLPVTTDPAFSEIDFGDWSGLSFENLAHRPGWHAWNAHRSTAQIPGGETMLAAQSRAIAGLSRLATSWPQQQIVVVSHADIIKAIVAHVLGMPLDLLRRLDIAPGSVSRVALGHNDARLLELNHKPGQ